MLLEKAGLGGVISAEYGEMAKKLIQVVMEGDMLGAPAAVERAIEELGVNQVVPVVLSTLARRLRQPKSEFEIFDLLNAISAMTEAQGIHGISAEDKVLIQVMMALCRVAGRKSYEWKDEKWWKDDDKPLS
jgi:hypothetical protein